jgi:hypothetical protein
MRIVKNLIEVTEPSVKAFLWEKNIPCMRLDNGQYAVPGRIDPIEIVSPSVTNSFTPGMVRRLFLSPMEKRWVFCFKVNEPFTEPIIVEREDRSFRQEHMYVEINPFTLQAERDGIIGNIITLCFKEKPREYP